MRRGRANRAMPARGRELSFSIAEKTASPTAEALPLKASAIGGQLPRPTAAALPDLSPDRLRPFPPTPAERAPARCPTLSAARSLTEQFARGFADRCCR